MLPLRQMVNVTAPGFFIYPRLSEGNYSCLMCMPRATPIVLALPGHFFHSWIDIETPRLFRSFHAFLLRGLFVSFVWDGMSAGAVSQQRIQRRWSYVDSFPYESEYGLSRPLEPHRTWSGRYSPPVAFIQPRQGVGFCRWGKPSRLRITMG